MSDKNATPVSAPVGSSAPRRRAPPMTPVAAYATLDEAQGAKDRLVKAGLNAGEVRIHGTSFNAEAASLAFWQRPFYRGALSGLSAGAVVGLLFGILSLFNVVSGILYVIFSEVVLGAVTGLIGFIVARARGGFESDETPRRFELMVPSGLVEKADAVLLRN